MPHDHHDHAHDDPAQGGHGRHLDRPDQDTGLSYWQVMEIAVRELLIAKNILTPAQIADQIAAMDDRSPANGAAVVARYWTDPDFADALLTDGRGAVRDMGFDLGPMHLIALPNTPALHNMVVCTLCSCYPRNLLGLPPDWYKSRAYRARTVRDPRGVLAEFGVTLPDGVQVRVHDSTADMRYIVLPVRPAGTDGWDVDRLAQLVTRDSMIGTGLPRQPL